MPDLGRYATEVISAYGLSLLLIAGLVWHSWWRAGKTNAALEQVESQTRNAAATLGKESRHG